MIFQSWSQRVIRRYDVWRRHWFGLWLGFGLNYVGLRFRLGFGFGFGLRQRD